MAYARVYNVGTKDDSEYTIDFLRRYEYGKGIILDEVITDIGSGSKVQRQKWNALLDDVMAGLVEKFFVTYKDRFVRFGVDWFERSATKFDTTIVVLNNPDLSQTEESTEDLISIILVFSCRLYGLRK